VFIKMMFIEILYSMLANRRAKVLSMIQKIPSVSLKLCLLNSSMCIIFYLHNFLDILNYKQILKANEYFVLLLLLTELIHCQISLK